MCPYSTPFWTLLSAVYLALVPFYRTNSVYSLRLALSFPDGPAPTIDTVRWPRHRAYSIRRSDWDTGSCRDRQLPHRSDVALSISWCTRWIGCKHHLPEDMPIMRGEDIRVSEGANFNAYTLTSGIRIFPLLNVGIGRSV